MYSVGCLNIGCWLLDELEEGGAGSADICTNRKGIEGNGTAAARWSNGASMDQTAVCRVERYPLHRGSLPSDMEHVPAMQDAAIGGMGLANGHGRARHRLEIDRSTIREGENYLSMPIDYRR